MKGCRPLTEAEVRVVLQSFGGRYALRDQALFLLGVKSGFRITELLSLRVGDVRHHGQLVDRVTIARRHMKQRREGRCVVLHPEAKGALAAWLEACARQQGPLAPEAYAFRSRKGANRPISRRQALRLLHEAYATNGLTGKVATHSMPKTFANHVYRHLSWLRGATFCLRLCRGVMCCGTQICHIRAVLLKIRIAHAGARVRSNVQGLLETLLMKRVVGLVPPLGSCRAWSRQPLAAGYLRGPEGRNHSRTVMAIDRVT
jgi:hypothetical protein